MLLLDISTIIALVLRVQVGCQTHETQVSFNLILLLFQFVEGPRPGDRIGTAFSSQQEAWPTYSTCSLF